MCVCAYLYENVFFNNTLYIYLIYYCVVSKMFINKMAIYNADNIPSTLEWIKTLQADEARAQCRALGITRGTRL